MSNRKSLMSDISRCNGVDVDPLCQSCARKIQISHDSKKAWYPHMYVIPAKGQCVYWIEEKSYA